MVSTKILPGQWKINFRLQYGQPHYIVAHAIIFPLLNWITKQSGNQNLDGHVIVSSSSWLLDIQGQSFDHHFINAN